MIELQPCAAPQVVPSLGAGYAVCSEYKGAN